MRVKDNTLLLYIGSLLFILKTVMSVSRIIIYTEMLDISLTVLGIIFIFASMFKKKYSTKEFFLYAIIYSFTLFNALITGQSALVITVLVCLALKDCDVEKYVKKIYIFELSFFCIHTILAICLYLFANMSIIKNIGGVNRFDFGMIHPNSFGALSFNLFIMTIWIYWRRIRKEHIILLFIAAISIYIFCKTRTNLLIMLAVISILVIYKLYNKFGKVINILAKYTFPMLTIIMLMLIVLFNNNNNIAKLFNVVLNARVLLGAYAYSKCGLTFLGQNLSSLYNNTVWDPIWKLNAFTFDSIYSYMLINQGIIWILVISFLFYRLGKRENVRDNVAIIAWSLYALTEVQGLNCFSCMPILLIVYILRKDD